MPWLYEYFQLQIQFYRMILCVAFGKAAERLVVPCGILLVPYQMKPFRIVYCWNFCSPFGVYLCSSFTMPLFDSIQFTVKDWHISASKAQWTLDRQKLHLHHRWFLCEQSVGATVFHTWFFQQHSFGQVNCISPLLLKTCSPILTFSTLYSF